MKKLEYGSFEIRELTQTQARDKVKEYLLELLKNDDPAFAHKEADSALCFLLMMSGYGDLIELYNKITRWFE